MKAKTMALTGIVLSLPFVILFGMLLFGVQMPAMLEQVPDSRSGSYITMGLLFLMVCGGVLNYSFYRKSLKKGIKAKLNLWVALGVLCVVVIFAGAIIEDQYPCWIGVPNCD